MIGGNTSSKTNSGASSTVGRPGISASTMPVSTNRMAGGIFSRAATTATAASTTSRKTRIWRVGSILVLELGAIGWQRAGKGQGRCRVDAARDRACDHVGCRSAELGERERGIGKRALAGGGGKHEVTVKRRVHGVNCAGEARLRHHRETLGLGLGELGIGRDSDQRRARAW